MSIIHEVKSIAPIANVFKFGSILFSICLVLSCSSQPELSTKKITEINPKAFRHIEATLFSGGQPSQTDLAKLRDAGIETIINLRPSSELNWDEKAVVTELGMVYVSIPIAGAKDISAKSAKQLWTAIEQNSLKPVLVHCASGNRVGALVAVAKSQLHDIDKEAAIAEGKQWGLTSLEDTVRSVIQTQ